jgi:hypothetical protein
MARDIYGDVRDKPWGVGQSAGVMALYNTEGIYAQTGDPLDPSYATVAMLGRVPEHLMGHYKSKGEEALDLMYRDSLNGLKTTLMANQSPELQSKIIDYKLGVSHIIGRLHGLGLLPFFEIEGFSEALDSLPVYFFTDMDITFPKGSAAFYSSGEHYIGILSNEMNQKFFLHEVTHALIEHHGTRGGDIGMWLSCKTLAEATVHHVADRGTIYSSVGALSETGTASKFGDSELKSRFSQPKFTKHDQKRVYEEDRKLMYELCIDGIGELTIQEEAGGRFLPAGIFARWSAK